MKRNVLLWWVASVALAGLLGYAFARYATPDHVTTVESTTSKQTEKELSLAREQVKTLTAQLETMKRHTVKRTVETFSSQGKPATRTVEEDTHVDRTTDRRTDTAAGTETAKVKTTETTATATKQTETVKDRPANRLSALIGINPQSGAVSYGGQYQRRLLGPVGVGIFGLGNSQSVQIGAGLYVEF